MLAVAIRRCTGRDLGPRSGAPHDRSLSHGEFHIYRIDPHKALLLCQDAMQAVKALVDYLREQLVTNDGWLQSP